ncbi:hypothetical protein EVAR_8217_1 [Eumeta japonica]|uniref:Uncharacterized protein n=1 Tax=Eumeta variegata TaxID=151549 RepID=A0A4C1TIN1_EUMVA|nr:hypothetical protein EVAR_8217_1 [Eumeta japonica]
MSVRDAVVKARISRPRSGLIRGSATGGLEPSEAGAGGARISGVAALMAGAARGRELDACGAIVVVSGVREQWTGGSPPPHYSPQRPRPSRHTPLAPPSTDTTRDSLLARPTSRSDNTATALPAPYRSNPRRLRGKLRHEYRRKR